MTEDGPKRKGRFIGRKSALYETVHISEFNFSEISTENFIVPDNPNSTIVHARYHENSEIENSVHYSARFDAHLLNPNYRPPNIKPQDFTDEWNRERAKAFGRKGKGDEDDDDEIQIDDAELAEIIGGPSNDEESSEIDPSQAEAEVKPDEGDPLSAETQDEEAEAPVHPVTLDELKKESESKSLDSTEPAESAINPEPQAHSDEAMQDAAETSETPIPDEISHKTAHEESEQESENSSQTPETNPSELDSGLITQINSELESVREQVMGRIEQNYLELASAICEKVIGKQLQTDPEAFGNLVRQAAKSALDTEDVVVHVGQKLYENLNHADPGLKLELDSSLAELEFRVAADERSVEMSIREMVDQLMEQANIKLFDDSESESDGK